jgi:hypothetical protein
MRAVRETSQRQLTNVNYEAEAVVPANAPAGLIL